MSDKQKPKNQQTTHHTQPILQLVASKWTMSVLYTLQQNTLRFNMLEKAIPDITQKSLTDTLRNLERNGMVDRRAYPTIPPQVEYKLTALGLELLKPCETMNARAERHQEEITRAQRVYERRIRNHPARDLLQ